MEAKTKKSPAEWVALACGYLISVAACLAFAYLFAREFSPASASPGIVAFYTVIIQQMAFTGEGRKWMVLITMAIFGPGILFSLIRLVRNIHRNYSKP